MSLPFNPQQEIAETRLLMVQAIAQNKARRLASQLPAAAADPLKPRQPCVMLVEDLAVNQLLFKKTFRCRWGLWESSTVPTG